MRRTIRTDARQEHAALGALLKQRREDLNLSQRDVASRLGRTQAYVWKVEKGIQHIDLASLMDLAEILETNASDLVEKVEDERARFATE